MTPDRRSWKFWRRMGEIFGHKWASQYGDHPTELWCGMLAQLTDHQISAGIALLVEAGEEWPPGLAAFRKLCVEGPATHGLPSADTAWGEALQIARRWKRSTDVSHAVVWHALSQIGDFTGIPEEVLEKRFRQNYVAAVSDFATGKPLAQIPQPLPKPQDVQRVMSAEERQAMLDDVDRKLAALGLKTARA